jgi:hypothetical protein
MMQTQTEMRQWLIETFHGHERDRDEYVRLILHSSEGTLTTVFTHNYPGAAHDPCDICAAGL